MNRKLENKVAVSTGESAGIGLNAVTRFDAGGSQVTLTGRRLSELAKAVTAPNGNVLVNTGAYECARPAELTEGHFDNTFTETAALSALLSEEQQARVATNVPPDKPTGAPLAANHGIYFKGIALFADTKVSNHWHPNIYN
jgi:NAD(P)-dependent dehydrogenase (short-subunit alcohol dehydrogenase family)